MNPGPGSAPVVRRKKRLSERTAPFVLIFSGLVGAARIAANPPRTATDWAVFAGIIAGIAALFYVGHLTVTKNNRRALAVLAPTRMPFTMDCFVDVATLRRFGGWGIEPKLRVPRTRCYVATDGNTLYVAPVHHSRKGVGPRPCVVDISRAGPGTLGRHMSDSRPALVIPVPLQGTVEPMFLIRQSWAKSGIHQSPLARFATPLPA